MVIINLIVDNTFVLSFYNFSNNQCLRIAWMDLIYSCLDVDTGPKFCLVQSVPHTGTLR